MVIIVKKKINIICLVFIRLQFIGEKVSRKQHHIEKRILSAGILESLKRAG